MKRKVYIVTTVWSKTLVTNALKSAHLSNCWRMKMNDPIVEEVRAARMEHTRKFKGDLKLICADLRRIQEEFLQRVVRVEPNRLASISREPRSSVAEK